MSQVRCLKIPASKVRLLSPKDPNMVSVDGDQSNLEIFIPDDAWLRWADIIQQHPTDSALFYCSATANYPFRYLGELTPTAEDLYPICEEDVWNRSCSLLLIHAEVASQWLIDNPYEN